MKHTSLLSFILSLLLVFSSLLISCKIPEKNVDISESTTTVTPSDTSDPTDSYTDYRTFSMISTIFSIYSIDKSIDYEKATEAAIDAFIAATGDKYARYYTEEEWKQEVADDNGAMYGIGVTVVFNYDDYSIETVFVIPNSPAEEAGIRSGMYITHIGSGENKRSTESIVKEYIDKYLDEYIREYRNEYPDEKDESVIEKSAKDAVAYLAYQYIVSQIKGDEGTYAEFSMSSEDGTCRDYRVMRAKVNSVSVRYNISESDSKIGIVTVSEFDLLTPKQFSEAMDDLISQGVEKFVFDMRNNPGGNLESVSAVLSYFLNKDDLIVITRDSSQKEERRYAVPVTHKKADSDSEFDYTYCDVSEEDIGKYRDVEKVVLINGNTASAAELFTAVLRDYELAETVGTKSYGKGSVQSMFDLSAISGGQYKGAIKLTTKLYYPPVGEGYDGGIGITPDYITELSEEAKKINYYKLTEQNDDQLKKAIELLQEQ